MSWRHILARPRAHMPHNPTRIGLSPLPRLIDRELLSRCRCQREARFMRVVQEKQVAISGFDTCTLGIGFDAQFVHFIPEMRADRLQQRAGEGLIGPFPYCSLERLRVAIAWPRAGC